MRMGVSVGLGSMWGIDSTFQVCLIGGERKLPTSLDQDHEHCTQKRDGEGMEAERQSTLLVVAIQRQGAGANVGVEGGYIATKTCGRY